MIVQSGIIGKSGFESKFYGFKSKSISLLWRGSRDGFGVKAFHSLCDGKPNTLTVIKNSKGFIFGGYTSVAWSSVYGYKSDNMAFLFSLVNPANIPLKLKIKSGDEQRAVYHDSDCGPAFGGLNLRNCIWGRDLIVNDASNSNTNSYINITSSSSYEAPPYGKVGDLGGKFMHGCPTRNFQTVEVEIFQVL